MGYGRSVCIMAYRYFKGGLSSSEVLGSDLGLSMVV